MTYKPTAIPNLPSTVDPGMRQFLGAIKEALEVRLRQRGNPLDAAPTFRDLLDAGLIQLKDGATIGGRFYTSDQLIGLVEIALPSWITSDTAPPPPTGLNVEATPTMVLLSWTTSGFDQYNNTEVWRSSTNNLSTAAKIGSTSGNTYTDAPPPAGQVYYYWIRDVANNPLLISPFNDVNGTATSEAPGAVTVTATFVGPDAEFNWPTPVSNFAVQLYVLEYFDASWLPLDIVAGNSYRFRAGWSGARSFRITAIDINGSAGPTSQFQHTVVVPAQPVVGVQFDGEQVVLSWTPPAATLPIERYEVYDGAVSPSNLIATLQATTFRTKVLWSSKTYRVVAVDTAGNKSSAGVAPVNVSPGTVYSLSPGDGSINIEVIDNNVLFRWKSTQGSLPIAAFELRRGPVWDTAEVIGKKDGGFTTVFEAPQSTVTYTYWLAAVDTAGNFGPPSSASATVSQPPDYVLAVNWVSTFTGTRSNAAVDQGSLVLPVNTTETWTTHFTARGWDQPIDQINAGYPIYAQPGNLSGYYEETFDYGATLAAMKIKVAYRLDTIAGSLSTAVSITVAQDAGFTVGVQNFTGLEAYAVNFRYVRVRVTVTATNDTGIGRLSDLVVKLDTKLNSFAGAVAANAGDSGGTTVYLTDDGTSGGNKVFIDVTSITVSALSATPLYAIYDFVDTINPLSFKVLLFNTSGVRVSGTVSYSVRGF